MHVIKQQNTTWTSQINMDDEIPLRNDPKFDERRTSVKSSTHTSAKSELIRGDGDSTRFTASRTFVAIRLQSIMIRAN